jgi:hypothetical protein
VYVGPTGMGFRRWRLGVYVYPSIFVATDEAAARVQRYYLMSVRLESVLVVVGALLASLSAAGLLPVHSAVLSAFVVSLSVLVTWVARSAKWERHWFDLRAVAETVKSLAWMYGLGVEPFHGTDADRLFATRLADAMKARQDVPRLCASAMPAAPTTISEELRRIRSLPISDRVEIYKAKRVSDQRGWYARAARRNGELDSRWFALFVTLQGITVVFAIALAVRVSGGPTGASIFTPVPAMAALAASLVAWVRTKRFSDLANSYAVAAQELSALHDQVPGVESAELEDWIQQVENAVSREHTMWLAKRG